MSDPIKTAVANHVQKHTMGHVQELTERLGMADASDIDIRPETELVTRIRVRTQNEGTRYFFVQVREQM